MCSCRNQFDNDLFKSMAPHGQCQVLIVLNHIFVVNGEILDFHVRFLILLSLNIFQWDILSIIQQCWNHLAKAVNSIDFHWFYHVWAENCVKISYARILKAKVFTIGTNEKLIKKKRKHAMESKQSRTNREKSVSHNHHSIKFLFFFFFHKMTNI